MISEKDAWGPLSYAQGFWFPLKGISVFKFSPVCLQLPTRLTQAFSIERGGMLSNGV